MLNQPWFLPLVTFCVMFCSYFLFTNLEYRAQLRERLKFSTKKNRQVIVETRVTTKKTQKTWWDLNVIEPLTAKNKKLAVEFRLRFERCGWDPASAPVMVPIYMTFSLFLSMGLFFALCRFSQIFNKIEGLMLWGVGFVFFFVGYRGFDYATDYLMARRRDMIIRDLPMVIDLLVICVRGGLTFEVALDRVAQEIVHLNPELSRELAITSAELGILPDRKVAYTNLARRVEGDLVATLTSSLVQSEEQGVAIGKTLVGLSQEASKLKLLLIEAKAAKLPSKLTVPVVLLSLPAIIIIILGPTISSIMSSDMFK